MVGRRHADARAYEDIKRSLVDYNYPPGKRIPVNVIADRLEVSIRPVREACRRLAAEHWLIEDHQTDFFAWHPPDDNALPGLYELSKTQLTYRLGRADPGNPANDRARAEIQTIYEVLTQGSLSDAELATYTGNLFLAIFELTGNPESTGYRKTRDYIHSINEWLYYLRMLECQYLEDVASELVNLCDLALTGSGEQLKQAILAYHRRRRDVLPKLSELLAAR